MFELINIVKFYLNIKPQGNPIKKLVLKSHNMFFGDIYYIVTIQRNVMPRQGI
jgi:hypothetical protein